MKLVLEKKNTPPKKCKVTKKINQGNDLYHDLEEVSGVSEQVLFKS